MFKESQHNFPGLRIWEDEYEKSIYLEATTQDSNGHLLNGPRIKVGMVFKDVKVVDQTSVKFHVDMEMSGVHMISMGATFIALMQAIALSMNIGFIYGVILFLTIFSGIIWLESRYESKVRENAHKRFWTYRKERDYEREYLEIEEYGSKLLRHRTHPLTVNECFKPE